MGSKKYFDLKTWKIIIFIIIFIFAILTASGPKCFAGINISCESSILHKITSYGFSVLLPGINNLLADNGFFIGHKTIGIWDTIPQLIVHIGLDLLYLYLLACIVVSIIRKFKK